MRIFIGIKHYSDNRNAELIREIKEIITSLGHEPYSFIDEGEFADEKVIMRKAFRSLEESGALILEASEPSFGAGIEAGYAFAKNKKIIVVAKEESSLSRTLRGVSDFYLFYKDFKDLKEKLKGII